MAARIRTAGSGEVQPIAGSQSVLKFSRAAPEVPPPFPVGETRQGGVPWRADVRESVASTAWRAREVMA